MKLIIELDDDEVRRLLLPLFQQVPASPATAPSRLLKVGYVAQQLRISRTKFCELVYTIAPLHRDQKAERRIPAKDILAISGT
jgi:hypothetical protein